MSTCAILAGESQSHLGTQLRQNDLADALALLCAEDTKARVLRENPDGLQYFRITDESSSFCVQYDPTRTGRPTIASPS
jgi:hypothetical protein